MVAMNNMNLALSWQDDSWRSSRGHSYGLCSAYNNHLKPIFEWLLFLKRLLFQGNALHSAGLSEMPCIVNMLGCDTAAVSRG